MLHEGAFARRRASAARYSRTNASGTASAFGRRESRRPARDNSVLIGFIHGSQGEHDAIELDCRSLSDLARGRQTASDGQVPMTQPGESGTPNALHATAGSGRGPARLDDPLRAGSLD